MSQTTSGDDEALVSVIIITYNHERFIEECIDSVLMQETDFPFEILISEDCSTDLTHDIVRDYQQQFPNTIRLLLSEVNRNDNEVTARAVRVAAGKYVVVMDGDDYWTSPRKLAKQVQYLEAHPECSLCYHNVEVVYDDGHFPTHLFYDRPRVSIFQHNPPSPITTLGDLVEGNFLATCSVMYRRSSILSFPDWFIDFPYSDWPMHVFSAMHGNLGYIDEPLGVYRIHQDGIWSAELKQRYGMSLQKTREMITVLEQFDTFLEHRFRDRIDGRIIRLRHSAIEMHCAEGQFIEARHMARGIVPILLRHPRLLNIHLLRAVIHTVFPRGYEQWRKLRTAMR
jgi:glycosyltransferase involved in cell wall biosynthesis